MKRRDFLISLGAAADFALSGKTSHAAVETERKEFVGILADTTRCLGCRTCEAVCAEAHGLPAPDLGDESVFDQERSTSDTQWTVVNRYETKAGEVFVKRQCMHCNQPACAAACLVKAMFKTEEGPVIWREDKCMGCRFCMISCPFDIPKFEYGSPVPKIQKCVMCWERLEAGKQPACVESCPGNALTFGKRRDLLDLAKSRIYQDPENYVHQIYGEEEVGGTGWLYLASAPFDQLGFNTDLGSTPYPEFTTGFLYGVPIVFILWPALLLGLSYATQGKE